MKRIIIDEKNEKQNEKNQNEIEIFKSLHHPNLIQYITSFIHKSMLCIIMEYADDGDLFKVVKDHIVQNKKIEEDLIWKWFLQMCQAIRYIHSKKIIHRDIKCQNIFLLKNGQIKLGDFGISKVLMDSFDFAKTPLGTPYFLSPEICSGSKYNFKIDMWMLGCVLYELAALHKPFEASTLPDLMKKIRERDILPIPKTYSDDLKFIISKLLCKEPNGRPSIKEVLGYDFIIAKMKKYGFTSFYDNWNECPDDNAPINEQSPNYSLFNLGYGDLNGIYNGAHPNSNDNNVKDEDGELNEADIDENNCGLTKKINNINISPSPTGKDPLVGDIPNINTNESKHEINSAITSKDMPFEEKIKQHIRNQKTTPSLTYSKPITKNRNTNSVGNLLSIQRNSSSSSGNENIQNYHSNAITNTKKTNEIEFTEDIEENDKKTITPIEYVTNPQNHQIYFKYNFYKEKLGNDKMDSYMKSIENDGGNPNNIDNYIKNIFGNVDDKINKQLTLFGNLIIKVCYGKK